MAAANGGTTMEAGLLEVHPGGSSSVAMKPGTLHNLEDVIAWVYGHEGVIEERWRNQFSSNNAVKNTTQMCQTFMQQELKELRKDIQGMRKFIYVAMGMVMLLSFAAPLLVTFMHR